MKINKLLFTGKVTTDEPSKGIVFRKREHLPGNFAKKIMEIL